MDPFHEPTADPKSPCPRQLLRIALNLKYLIDKIVPIEYNQEDITMQGSRIINRNAVKLAFEACGGENSKKRDRYRSSVLFCLLKVSGWYGALADTELHDARLYELRGVATLQLCRLVLEELALQKDDKYLFIDVLCRRFSINLNDEDSMPESPLELALDMHATPVISTCTYQRCLKWLWRGWIVQSDETFIIHDTTKGKFHPDRLKTPLYQNILEIWFAVLYLVLFTLVVNSKLSEKVTPIDFFEWTFYLFTVGFLWDEIVKVFHVGYAYLTFWSAFNDSMYALIFWSMSVRMYAVTHHSQYWDIVSYRILSCCAPMVWMRMLLYLDAQKFVGALIVVVKMMMKESLIFFVLLFFVIMGFLQGFLGLDMADGDYDQTSIVLVNLVKTVLGSGSFDVFEKFAPPYAGLLYGAYSFVVSVILLNILVALYASAYDKIVSNATDEFLAVFASKTLRYIRAPDENVYVPPFNLIELALTPVVFFLSKETTRNINNVVMACIYSPLLVYIGVRENRDARSIAYNRMKHLADDANEIDTPWDLHDGFVDDGEDSVRETQIRNRQSFRQQRLAELQDPDFMVSKDWYRRVKQHIQPVKEGEESGVGWELYKIYDMLKDIQSRLDERAEPSGKSEGTAVEPVTPSSPRDTQGA